MALRIRQVSERDAEAWSDLYRGYRSFYEMLYDDDVVGRTWEWVSSGSHGFVGLVAELDGNVIGLANLRWYARPSTATLALYLDDLFVAPGARGQGAAHALIERSAQVAGDGNGTLLRWHTAADNHAARRVYDDLATQTPWVIYDMAPTTKPNQ